MTYESPVDINMEGDRLLSRWFISLFIISTLFICVLLYPAKTIRHQVLNATDPQPIVLFYLTQLLQRHPNDAMLHIAMAQQLIGLYHWSSAEKEINWLAAQPNYLVETRLLRFQLHYTEAYQLPLGVKRNQAFAALRLEVVQFRDVPLTQQQLQDMASMALSINQPRIALSFYQRLQDIHDANLLRDIARVALESSQYAVCAEYYMLAYRYETLLVMKRNDVMAALKAYEAGGLLNEGIALIKLLPPEVTNTHAMLVFITQYALAAGHPEVAQIYIKRALLMHGVVRP